jgi:hypothetical protein
MLWCKSFTLVCLFDKPSPSCVLSITSQGEGENSRTGLLIHETPSPCLYHMDICEEVGISREFAD